MNRELATLPWLLIIGLGVFGLVRPVMNIVGLMGVLGKPLAPILVTILISAVWITVVLKRRSTQVLLTLTCVGFVYGFAAILLSAILSPLLSGTMQGPLTTPLGIGVLATLIGDTVWGALTGLVAVGIRQRRGQHSR